MNEVTKNKVDSVLSYFALMILVVVIGAYTIGYLVEQNTKNLTKVSINVYKKDIDSINYKLDKILEELK